MLRRLLTRSLPILLLVALRSTCPAQDPEVLSNGGFEAGDNGLPVDWEILGQGELTGEARSGDAAFRLIRPIDADVPETGLNRAWSPGSGAQGAMLEPLRGAVTFWYRVVRADEDALMRFNVIPMTDEPFEDLTASRAYFDVPRSHVDDGQWHHGVVAYDFRAYPGVRWVQVSPRLTGGGAELILDDIEWAERLGPYLAIDQIDVLEGRRILRVRVSNLGDEPCALGDMTLDLPPGVEADPLNEAPAPTDLLPGQRFRRHWRIEGPIEHGAAVTVSLPPLTEGASPIKETIHLEARVIAYSLMVDPPVVEPGQEATVTLGAMNYGPASSGPLSLELTLPDALELVGPLPEAGPVEQGEWATHGLRVRALTPTPSATIQGVARIGDEEWPVAGSVVIAPAPGPDAVTVQSGDLRLLVAQSPWGAGPVRIEARSEGEWRPVGWLPHLGRVTTVDPDGVDETVVLCGRAEAMPGGVSFSGSTADSSGALWQSDVSIAMTSTPGLVSLSYRVRCDRDRSVRSFEGPALRISAQGDEGLLPGVEWVEGEDETSSNRDLALSLPDRLRYVPDGYDLTMPLVAVRGGEVTTALLWDIHQRWDQSHDKPAVYFSRPGYLAGSHDAAMGLFAPSVGEGWLDENQVQAEAPYPLEAGRSLRLDASLLVRTESTSVLDAVDVWLDRYGLPEPGTPPRGDWVSEVEFSARAYMESLYDEEEGDWWQTVGGGHLLSQKTPASPHFAWDLERAARITNDPARAEVYREWAARVTDTAGYPPQGFDGGLEYSNGSEWLSILAGAAKAALASQREDGSWGYPADREGEGVFADTDYWELGDLGGSELGTNARNALDLLRYARVTGDERAYEAGIRALEYMDRFTVPRAGQVWEVPAHVPDIIAAADAIEAYLEAYRFDGDTYWRDCAVYWAMAGVPFVYLWGEPERPYLPYASIAVYGGTFYVMNWIGRPVQWCGLNYATALRQLAEFDDTQDWARLAEGILISALHQQSTEDVDVALWPDWIGAREGDKSAWLFSPMKLCEHLYAMLGVPSFPRTAIIGEGQERLHLSTMGDVLQAAFEGGTLTVDTRLDERVRSRLLIGPIAPPGEVLVDGGLVYQAPGPDGWAYLARYAVLSVPLPGGGEHQVRVAGVTRASLPEPPPLVTELAFEFEDSGEGWLPQNDVSPLAVEDGALAFRVTGTDPYVVREAMEVPTHLGDTLTIRMSLDMPTVAQVFWATEDSPRFTEGLSFAFTPIADGEMHEYSFPVGLHPEWPDRTLTMLRIDPTSGEPASVAIDRVVLAGGAP
ncbi:MAG: hypothetical protein ACOX6M_05020 [Armatimonadota bacterium]